MKVDTICKLKKKQIKDNLSLLKGIIENPKYLCGRCGRSANKKKFLCKPEALSKI